MDHFGFCILTGPQRKKENLQIFFGGKVLTIRLSDECGGFGNGLE